MVKYSHGGLKSKFQRVQSLFVIFHALLFGLLTPATSFSGEKLNKVGVYYFPGWHQEMPLMNRRPWDSIKKFPERKPTLGWYDDGDIEIIKAQKKMMAEAGIDFVIFDWYWVGGYGVRLNAALDAYLKLPSNGKVEFSVMWANHTGTPTSLSQFDQVVDYWINNCFSRPDYKLIDGRPVIFIFSPYLLELQAKKFGLTAKYLLARARSKAVKRGYKGIYFVASSQAQEKTVKEIIPSQAYDALSAYNYSYGTSGTTKNKVPSKSYEELSAGYHETWEWMMKNSPLPYMLPATSGWDRRPWGGSKNPEHDNSYSTLDEFSDHLNAAFTFLNSHPEKTLRTVVICCWNEYGEGSYIEPTAGRGNGYLDAVSRNKALSNEHIQH